MATVAASTMVINLLWLLMSLIFILSLSSSTAYAEHSRPEVQFAPPGPEPVHGSPVPVRGSRSRKGSHGRK